MQYCKKCLVPDTRPGIQFDEEGVCAPCRYFESFSEVDWVKRNKELENIVSWGKKHTKSEYDCIISVSGGKDSTRQAMYARDNLGMNPLLVSTVSPPEMLTDIGVSNLANLIELGFDVLTVEPDPITYKSLMRTGFTVFGNYCKSTELTLYASAPRVAIAYGIPLVFLGENGSLMYGDSGASQDGGDGNTMKNGNTLAGGVVDWMCDGTISDRNLIPYFYPDEKEFKDANLRIVFLGFYIQDFNNFENGRFAIANGLKIRDALPQETGSLNPFDALDEDFVHVNQMLKYFKFGFGKATDEVCEAIRLGLMTREEGKEKVEKYDGLCSPKFIKKFCQYLEISEDEFNRVADSFRNEEIFKKTENGEWERRIPVH